MNMTDALRYAIGAASGGGGRAAQLNELALASMQTHGLAYDLGLALFGSPASSLVTVPCIEFVPAPPALELPPAGVVYLVGTSWPYWSRMWVLRWRSPTSCRSWPRPRSPCAWSPGADVIHGFRP